MENQNKILIVDDIELNRAILSELFYNEYEILEAENGEEAIEIICKYSTEISIILLDIVMPVVDGFGVLKEMVKHKWISHIPVIMITAETSDSVMQKGYEMGAVDIISKPFNPNIVRQRIHNIVEQYTYKLNLENLVQQQTEALRRQAQKLRETSTQMIDTLSAVIEFKNAESVTHIQNIRILTRLLMKELSVLHKEYCINEEMTEMISEAAAMHDIGKIAIPDHILNKPGKLTMEEFEVMKTHTLRGCEILQKLSSVQYLGSYEYCYEICRHHHERWDGKGYPDGLKGDQIPIWAQVVSLADVYDALTSKRVYKDAYSSKVAVQMILNGECGVFNPVLIQCFQKIISVLGKEGIHPEIRKYNSFEMVNEQNNVTVNRYHDVISTRTLRLLELERQKYRIMSELSGEILFDYDRKEDKLTFSEKFQELTGNDLVIENINQVLMNSNIVPEKNCKELFEKASKITHENPTCKLELPINLNNAGFEWYEVYLYPVWDMEEEQHCMGFMGKLISIEKQKQRDQQLLKAANSDPLTELLNRNALQKQIKTVLENNLVEKAVVCFIDIDNFKAVNDNRGHLFGDKVLKKIATLLLKCTRKTDIVGRIGGDEFIVFFKAIATQKDLERKLREICSSLQSSLADCEVTGSVGAACYPQDGTDFEVLLNKADQALYFAKQKGKNCFQIYNESCKNLPFRSLQSSMDDTCNQILK